MITVLYLGWNWHPTSHEAQGETWQWYLTNLRTTVEAADGYLMERQDTALDSLIAAFTHPSAGVAAAMQAQQDCLAQSHPNQAPWRLRAAIHTVDAAQLDDPRVSAGIDLCIQLGTMGHGGQILLSSAAANLVRHGLPAGVDLLPLGLHRPPDLSPPKSLFQLVHPALPATFPPLRSLDGGMHNLPIQLTSFIGRTAEVVRLQQELRSTRLLTLTGPGGCGKTRLALHTAAHLVPEYRDGVWFVELAPLAEPELIPHAIAMAVGLREVPGQSIMTALLRYAETKQLLLVLDNCEHLVASCVQVVHSLLLRCPDLHILATSRSTLGVPSETIWRVPSFATPEVTTQITAQDLLRNEAVRLFVDRAALALPDFRLTTSNAPAVAQICARLDGLPLAIELAATRVRMTAVEEIGARLDHRFQLLTGGHRTALPRQRTLRAAVDWSHDLLPEQERILWYRLSVFAGSFTVEAAEAVCAGEAINPAGVLPLLDQLVDKSIVLVGEQAGETRYRLLETMRQYGQEKLQDDGQEAVLRDRHLTWCLNLVNAAVPALAGPDPVGLLERLGREQDNLRAALFWARAHAHTEAGLTLATTLFLFWYRTGRLNEGRGWLESFLPQVDGISAMRANALYAAGCLAEQQGEFAAAQQQLAEAAETFRRLDDRGGHGEALVVLGLVVDRMGEHLRARELIAEGVALLRQAGDTPRLARAVVNAGSLALRQGEVAAAKVLLAEGLVAMQALGRKVGVATVLHNLGYVAFREGAYVEAQDLYEKSLAMVQELEDPWQIALFQSNLAELASAQGDHGRALRLYQQSLALCRKLDDKTELISSLVGIAAVMQARGVVETAIRLLGAAEALRMTMRVQRASSDHAAHERLMAAVQKQCSPAAFRAAWDIGLAMPLEQAIAAALAVDLPPLPDRSNASKEQAVCLTAREWEVADLVAAGLTDKEIGDSLFISRRTVGRHLEKIFAKLEISSRSKLIAWVLQAGNRQAAR